MKKYIHSLVNNNNNNNNNSSNDTVQLIAYLNTLPDYSSTKLDMSDNVNMHQYHSIVTQLQSTLIIKQLLYLISACQFWLNNMKVTESKERKVWEDAAGSMAGVGSALEVIKDWWILMEYYMIPVASHAMGCFIPCYENKDLIDSNTNKDNQIITTIRTFIEEYQVLFQYLHNQKELVLFDDHLNSIALNTRNNKKNRNKKDTTVSTDSVLIAHGDIFKSNNSNTSKSNVIKQESVCMNNVNTMTSVTSTNTNTTDNTSITNNTDNTNTNNTGTSEDSSKLKLRLVLKKKAITPENNEINASNNNSSHIHVLSNLPPPPSVMTTIDNTIVTNNNNINSVINPNVYNNTERDRKATTLNMKRLLSKRNKYAVVYGTESSNQEVKDLEEEEMSKYNNNINNSNNNSGYSTRGRKLSKQYLRHVYGLDGEEEVERGGKGGEGSGLTRCDVQDEDKGEEVEEEEGKQDWDVQGEIYSGEEDEEEYEASDSEGEYLEVEEEPVTKKKKINTQSSVTSNTGTGTHGNYVSISQLTNIIPVTNNNNNISKKTIISHTNIHKPSTNSKTTVRQHLLKKLSQMKKR